MNTAPETLSLPRPPKVPNERAQAFFANPTGTLLELEKEFGPVYRLPLAEREVLLINDATLAEKALRDEFDSFGFPEEHQEVLRPLLGNSMPITSDFHYWEQLHKIIFPMFTPKMLKLYFEQTVQVVTKEVHHVEEMAKRGETVDFLQLMRTGVFTALTKTMFVRGVKEEDIAGILDNFTEASVYINMRYHYGVTAAETSQDPEILKGKAAMGRLNDYVYKLIDYRRANLVDEPEDMLDILLAGKLGDGALLNDEEIRDNVMALFFGGEQTTPSVTAWAFNLISANPEKRELMFEEIDRVLEGRAPTFQELGKLEYTDGVLDEALRLYAPFTWFGREAKRDLDVGGFQICKGDQVGFVGWTIHRDPIDWPEPETFDPLRHSKEKRAQRRKCSMIAFGYGHRRCTGERVGRMESLLMLAMLSQKAIFDRIGGGMSPVGVVLAPKPADNLPMTISLRA